MQFDRKNTKLKPMTTQQQTTSSETLEIFTKHANRIKEAFYDHADQEGFVGIEAIQAIVKDLQDLIDIDFENDTDFFLKESNHLSLKEISSEDFEEILKSWMLHKSQEKNNTPSIELRDQENSKETTKEPSLVSNKGTHAGNRANGARKVRRSLEKPNFLMMKIIDEQLGSHTNDNSTVLPPQNYQENCRKLNDLIARHKKDFEGVFDDRANPDSKKLVAADYFIFLQECFYLDNILLMQNESDELDFFQTVNSYRRFLKVAEAYFTNAQGDEPRHFNSKETEISFTECFEILIYWFQTDKNVILIEEREKEQREKSNENSKLKNTLLETVAKYRNMLNEAPSEIEKQVLQTAIETLLKKVNELDAPKPSDELTSEDTIKSKKRIKALQEIFDFYSKQQLGVGRPETFDKIQRHFKSVNIGKFSVILKDFRMKMDKLKLKEVFKKTCSNSEDLSFEEFQSLFSKIAKDVELITEQRVVKPNKEIMKGYKPDSYKQRSRSESKRGDEADKSKCSNEKIEEIWEHMGLYDGTYKNNMQPIQSGLGPQEKENLRSSLNISVSKKKILTEKIVEVEKEEKPKAKGFSLKTGFRDPKMIERSRLRNSRDLPPLRQQETNNLSQDKKDKAKLDFPMTDSLVKKKVTFEPSQKKDPIEEKFDPFDLIEETDEEDSFFLAEYGSISRKKGNIGKENVEVNKREGPRGFKRQSTIPNTNKPSEKINPHVNRSEIIPNTHRRPDRQSKPFSLNDLDLSKEQHLNSRAHTEYGDTTIPNSNKNMDNVLKDLYFNINLENSTEFSEKPRGRAPSMSDRPGGYHEIHKSQILDRLNQIQQNTARREREIMANLINIQNFKMEQGLRAARK